MLLPIGLVVLFIVAELFIVRGLYGKDVHLVHRGLLGRYMRRRHWEGFTTPMPWPLRSCVHYWEEPDPSKVVHEQVHVDQIARDGRIRFAWRYLRDWTHYRYHDIPYEAAAYAAEDQWAKKQAA